jgi:hypothetical protein
MRDTRQAEKPSSYLAPPLVCQQPATNNYPHAFARFCIIFSLFRCIIPPIFTSDVAHIPMTDDRFNVGAISPSTLKR